MFACDDTYTVTFFSDVDLGERRRGCASSAILAIQLAKLKQHKFVDFHLFDVFVLFDVDRLKRKVAVNSVKR